MPVKMGDSGYEYECSRAELLGVSPPSYEEYLKKVADRSTVEVGEEDLPKEAEVMEESVKEDDSAKTATSSGKLEEINNILQSTQEKFNRFKVSYGSLTNALKSRLGKSLDLSFSQSETNGSSQANVENESTSANTDKSGQSIIGSGSIGSDKDKEMISNRMGQNGQSIDLCQGSGKEDDLEYKEIELNDSKDQIKSPETKKFLNFGFLNLGGGK